MKEIDWTKWSSIAEIIAAVSIVVTLLYLAVQTQQNTDALVAVSRQAILQAELDGIGLTLAYPDFGGASSRTPAETRQLGYIYNLRRQEFAWAQYQSGILDETTWLSYLNPMRFSFVSGEGRAFLDEYVGDPEFKAYLIEWVDQYNNSSQ